MGIDVQFQAIIPSLLSKQDVAELWQDMKEALGATWQIERIKIATRDELYLDDVSWQIPDGCICLDFVTLCRVYGEYYTRGNPLPWIIFAEYIEWRYPQAWVSYGGDGYLDIQPWTKEEREKLKLFYFEHGNKPSQDDEYRKQMKYNS